MDFRRFAQVFYNLSVILQIVLAQLSDLISEDVNTPKVITVAEINPVIKFKLGTFKSPDNYFYKSDYNVKSIKYKKKMPEGIIEFENKRRHEQKRTGHQEIFKWKNFKEKKNIDKQRRQSDWNQSNRTPINLISKSSELSGILGLISEIIKQIKKLKTLPKLLQNLRAELLETEKSLILSSFENLLRLLEKNFLDDKAENKIKMKEKNGFGEMNNQTYNIQYQIENLFIFNQLSEKNNSKLKETDVGISNKLTACKMQELLEKAVSNLNGNGISQGDIFAVTQPSLQKNQMNFLEELQRNFLKIFHTQNVTLKHIKQMSKIVDFVERYHGAVSELKTSPEQNNEERNNVNSEKSNQTVITLQQFLEKCKTEKKVLVDDEFEIFGSEAMNEKTAVRRKG